MSGLGVSMSGINVSEWLAEITARRNGEIDAASPNGQRTCITNCLEDPQITGIRYERTPLGGLKLVRTSRTNPRYVRDDAASEEPVSTPPAPEEAQLDPEILANAYRSNVSSAAAGAMGVLSAALAPGELAVAATADFTHGTGTAVFAPYACCT